jgi:glutaminyl-peptide cyclotransferase
MLTIISIGLALLLVAGLIVTGEAKSRLSQEKPGEEFKGQFNGERALSDVQYQLDLGARTPGSMAHQQEIDWIVNQLRDAGWDVEAQETSYLSHPIHNIIARWGQGEPWVLLGAHYDSRMVADHDLDTDKRSLPVPGANDGASGVAVLLEIARVLPSRMEQSAMRKETRAQQVWLAFFDAEDQGNLPGWDWILGSRALVESLDKYPDSAVIVDMVGDSNLDLYLERNSDTVLEEQIWSQASELGFPAFKPQSKYSILDDHTPFLEVGIPAADIIDFDYPFWHTTQDTLDKVSAESLYMVGETLLAWLTK